MNEFDIGQTVQRIGEKAWALALKSVIVESWIEIGFSGIGFLTVIVGLILVWRGKEYSAMRGAGAIVAIIGGLVFLICLGDGIYGIYLPELVAINRILHR